jgi:hypothetical protein
MALAAGTIWEVRTTGAATNGGAFNPLNAVPGTDRSQQDAAQFTYTDLVISGSTFTSAAFPFSSAERANVINITGGTGFTTGRYEILSVSGVTATLDRSPGTNGSTGGAGKLGGAVTDLATVGAAVVPGNTVYIKTSGGYSISTGLTFATQRHGRLPDKLDRLLLLPHGRPAGGPDVDRRGRRDRSDLLGGRSDHS